MTIRETAYNTTACSGYSQGIEKIREKILVRSSIFSPGRLVEVDGGSVLDININSFAHPLQLSDTNIAIDVRPYGKWSDDNYKFMIRDQKGYDGLVLRGKINTAWISGKITNFRGFSHLPIYVFSTMLSEAINKRIPIDPDTLYKISILAAVFYYSNFVDEKLKSDELKDMMGFISTACNFNISDVKNVVESHDGDFSNIDSVEHFCLACKTVTENIRLDKFNTAVLFGTVNGYWYGNNSSELICTALEHPPTWLTLIYLALTERGFKNTGLSMLLERSTFKRLSTNFEATLLNKVGI